MKEKNEVTKQAELIINENSKIWFSAEIGMTRPTLDIRLKNDKWGKLEIEKIKSIYSEMFK